MPSAAGSAERLLPGWGNFLEHVVSKVWCTYREGFAPVGPPIFTTDAGWGCMLRTAQMMLAQTLMRIDANLGDDWLLPSSPALLQPEAQGGAPSEQEEPELTASSSAEAAASLSPYRQLLRLFGDEQSAACPFSLHYMLQVGADFGMTCGQWYGPALAAQVLERLVNRNALLNWQL